MKTLLLALTMFAGICLHTQAQYVSIPDTSFGTWLNTNGYSACLQGNNTVGWQMDTTCPAVQSVTSVIIGFNNGPIHDLTGIQYFDALLTLSCSSIQLETIPRLPSNLTALILTINPLSGLPPLPGGLVTLDCSSNELTSLPAIPPTLTYLNCNNNFLTSLPALNNIESLDCSNNNGLTSLPALPGSLEYLKCDYTSLTSLPALPNTLRELYANNSQLTSVPPMYHIPSMQFLYLNNNQLTSIASFPNAVGVCSIGNNPLLCLPVLTIISNLNFTNTSVICVSNYGTVQTSNPNINSLPICQTGNPNGCAGAWYVSIPDTSFGTWLNTNGYSACLQGNNTVGWQMDTTCPAVQSATSVSIGTNNGPIRDLTGIQYFDSLESFSAGNMFVPSLPRLPSRLIYLHCTQCGLTSLPALPSGLRRLYVNQNNLTSLPALPAGLEEIHCIGNPLTTFPALPTALTELVCHSCSITTLPALPNSLTQLQCQNNQLTSLPTLPSGLKYLICDDNQLTSLPALPAGLMTARCHHNQLTSLPALPNSLTLLEFQNNLLTTLPSLSGLGTQFRPSLYFNDNQITSFPDFPPRSSTFNISNNPLTCLPTIPSGIDGLSFTNTLVTCAPNHTNITSNPDINSLPLCLPNNPNGCPAAPIDSCAGFSLLVTSATNGALPDTLCVTTTGTPPFIYNWDGNVTGLPNLCFQLVSGDFSITVTDSIGCTAFYTTDSLCANECVWPGDADYNGIADHNDLLPIGLAYGKTGPARAQQDINWYAHPAQDWIDTISVTGTGSMGTNLLTLSSPINISLGMAVSGSGIAPGAVVTSIAGTTIAVSIPNTAAVSDTITFVTPAVSSGINSKQIDCDGNGIVNAADTLAIMQNFGQLHAKHGAQTEWGMTDPTLYVALAPDTTVHADTLYAEIALGDSILPANNVYGLAFTVNYDLTVVDTSKTATTFGDSWLGNATDKISIAKDLKTFGQLKCAITRIDHTPRSGYGIIGEIRFVITTDNINGKDALGYYENIVWISDLTVIDNLGMMMPINEGADTSQIEFLTGIHSVQLDDTDLQLIPNPAIDQVQLRMSDDVIGGEMKVADVTGRVVFNTRISTNTALLTTKNFTSGIYLVQVITEKGMLTKRLVIMK